MADVPLGMFLSGGLDSSAIAALMARHDRPAAPDLLGRVRGARVQRARLRAPGRAARSAPTRTRSSSTIDDFFGALPRLVWHEDEPIAHPSSVPLYFVSALAREHVKVVLTGEGSDELLAGYGKYPRALVNWRAGAVYERWCPEPLRAVRRDTLVPRLPGRVGALRRAIVPRDGAHAGGDVLRQLRGDRPRAPGGAARSRRLRGCATPRRAYGAVARLLRRAERAAARSLDRLLYADMKTYLVELLMKQDQMSMAASIESRVPFLDHQLVEFAAALPPR